MGILSYIKKRLSGQKQIDDSKEKSIDFNNDSNNNEISLDITSKIEPVTEDRKIYEENFPEIKERAENGEALFMTDLGLCYNQGWGTPIDKDKALYWTQKAAEHKDPMGLHNLGVHYRDGDHVPIDLKKARECFLEASNLGLSRSSNDLGVMYYLGQGVDKNYEIAAKWYKKAIEQDNPFHLAFKNLAYLYKHGLGVKQDIFETLTLLDKGSKVGSYQCEELLRIELFNLYIEGVSLYYGKHSNPSEKEKGASYIYFAADLVFIPAMKWAFSNKVNHGKSIIMNKVFWDLPCIDYVEITRIMIHNPHISKFQDILQRTKDGVQNGNRDDMCYLALIKLFVKSFEDDSVDVIDLLNQSAKLGYTTALFWLGYCYENGFIVEQNMELAKSYYFGVIQRGYSEYLWLNTELLGISDNDRALAESHLHLSQILFNEGKNDEAKSFLALNYGECKNHVQSVLQIGKIYLAEGNLEEAFKAFNYCIHYKCAEAAFEVAKYYLDINDKQQFKQHCFNAILFGSIPAVGLWLENQE